MGMRMAYLMEHLYVARSLGNRYPFAALFVTEVVSLFLSCTPFTWIVIALGGRMHGIDFCTW